MLFPSVGSFMLIKKD